MKTRFPGLEYRGDKHGWSLYDSDGAQIGTWYQTKAELLADLQRAAEIRGFAPMSVSKEHELGVKVLAILDNYWACEDGSITHDMAFNAVDDAARQLRLPLPKTARSLGLSSSPSQPEAKQDKAACQEVRP